MLWCGGLPSISENRGGFILLRYIGLFSIRNGWFLKIRRFGHCDFPQTFRDLGFLSSSIFGLYGNFFPFKIWGI
jgi:hypothetical protein